MVLPFLLFSVPCFLPLSFPVYDCFFCPSIGGWGQHDQEQAHYWFTQSAAQGNEYAQFFLERWDNLKSPSVMLSVTRLLHHMSRVFQEKTPVPAVPGGIQIDRKRLRQLREKKIAMGHKPDDREEQEQQLR